MFVEWGNSRIRLPDFFIIGTARAGTTSLFHYLNQHPRIFFPRNKEPFFFSFMNQHPSRVGDPRLRRSIVWGIDRYEALYKKAGKNQICGDGSTTYLYTHQTAIDNIKNVYKKQYKTLKVIAVLRNPADRAFSHFMYFVRKDKEWLSFPEAIEPSMILERTPLNPSYDYIGYGNYYRQVKAFKETFPHFRVYLFEELKKPANMIKDLFDFLGVDPGITVNLDFSANPSGFPRNRLSRSILNFFSRHPRLKTRIDRLLPGGSGIKHRVLEKLLKKAEMPPEIKSSLIEGYRENIMQLQDLLQRDLSHWLKV